MLPKSRKGNRVLVASGSVLVMLVAFCPLYSEAPSVPALQARLQPRGPELLLPVTHTPGISAEFQNHFSSWMRDSLPKPNEKSFVLQACGHDRDNRIRGIDQMLTAEFHTEHGSNYVDKCLWCKGQACGFSGDDHTPLSDFLRHQLHIKASESDEVYRATAQMFLPNCEILPAQVISTWLAAFVSWLFVRMRKRRSLILRSKAPGNT